MADIVLKTEHLCKFFGATKANNDLNLEVPRGAVLGLAGENGSARTHTVAVFTATQK